MPKDITKTCQQCGQPFRLIGMELKFYKRFGYPEPEECPNCREKRRKVLRNPHKFFKRLCGNCNRQIITTHDPKKGLTVYCEKCYANYYNISDPLEKGRAPDKKGKVIVQ